MHRIELEARETSALIKGDIVQPMSRSAPVWGSNGMELLPTRLFTDPSITNTTA